MEKSWASRTRALYTAESPCGWYFPSTYKPRCHQLSPLLGYKRWGKHPFTRQCSPKHKMYIHE